MWPILQIAVSETTAAWVQAFGSIAAIIGAAWISRREWTRSQYQQRLAVSAQLAVELRLWMDEVYSNYCLIELHDETGGQAGEQRRTIPEFSFSKDFSVLGVLASENSSALIGLELARRDIWRDQRFSFETNSLETEMFEDFCGSLGKLYAAVSIQYERLVKIAGFTPDQRLDRMKSVMDRAAARSSVKTVDDL